MIEMMDINIKSLDASLRHQQDILEERNRHHSIEI